MLQCDVGSTLTVRCVCGTLERYLREFGEVFVLLGWDFSAIFAATARISRVYGATSSRLSNSPIR